MSANRFNFRIWNEKTKEMSPPAHLAITAYPIMQSTGLVTKNGKEVFESDILEIPPWHGRSTLFGEVRFIEYEDGESYADFRHFGWSVSYSSDGNLYSMTLPDALESDAIIIGNIYENPDLLKK